MQTPSTFADHKITTLSLPNCNNFPSGLMSLFASHKLLSLKAFLVSKTLPRKKPLGSSSYLLIQFWVGLYIYQLHDILDTSNDVYPSLDNQDQETSAYHKSTIVHSCKKGLGDTTNIFSFRVLVQIFKKLDLLSKNFNTSRKLPFCPIEDKHFIWITAIIRSII